MAFDISAATPILKQYYTAKKIETLVFQSPLQAIIPKDTSGSGVSYVGAIRSALTSAVSFTDTVAFANGSSSVYKQWVCPWRSGYGRALVSGAALDQCGNDRGAFVKAVISETEGAYAAIGQQIGAGLWHNGGGSIGKLDGSTTVTGLVQTLANPSDAINFRPGQTIKSSATDGTSGSVRVGSVTLTAVDLFTGVLTASGNWDAGITTPVNTDYLFMDGDFGLAFQGVPAWIVPNALRAGTLGTAFNGVTRSADPVRLAGVPYDDPDRHDAEPARREADAPVPQRSRLRRHLEGPHLEHADHDRDRVQEPADRLHRHRVRRAVRHDQAHDGSVPLAGHRVHARHVHVAHAEHGLDPQGRLRRQAPVAPPGGRGLVRVPHALPLRDLLQQPREKRGYHVLISARWPAELPCR